MCLCVYLCFFYSILFKFYSILFKHSIVCFVLFWFVYFLLLFLDAYLYSNKIEKKGWLGKAGGVGEGKIIIRVCFLKKNLLLIKGVY